MIILAVTHDVFRSYLKNKVFDNLKVDGFIYDVKSYFKPNGRIISFEKILSNRCGGLYWFSY